jgi:hypothetical protein
MKVKPLQSPGREGMSSRPWPGSPCVHRRGTEDQALAYRKGSGGIGWIRQIGTQSQSPGPPVFIGEGLRAKPLQIVSVRVG